MAAAYSFISEKLAPIAISIAATMGLKPAALIVAITFGSSAAFAMPIGYQTRLMTYGPSGYRFKDFIRLGIVLDLLVAMMARRCPAIWMERNCANCLL